MRGCELRNTHAPSDQESQREFYFLLRGDNEYLALGELRALLEAYNEYSKMHCYTMLCTVETREEVARELVNRAGFIKEAGVVHGVYDVFCEEDAVDAGKAVSGKPVYSTILKATVSDEDALGFLKSSGIKRSYRRGLGYRLYFTDGYAVLGSALFIGELNRVIEKSRSRPFKRSIALKPDLARALVNLTRARRGDILVDPFAGTGMVIIEAWSMGVLGLGVDIDYRVAMGMRSNIEFYRAPLIPLIGDSSVLLFREVDRVATDLPYGRGASTHGVEIRELYESFIQRMSEYLSSRGYASFLAPIWLEDYVDELITRYGFRLVERYYDYVHGGLVRVVSVVRKW
jgi:tRNA (guanine10-N2)-dimethyltransferase